MIRFRSDYESGPLGVQGESAGPAVPWSAAAMLIVAIVSAWSCTSWADDAAESRSASAAKPDAVGRTQGRPEARVALKPSPTQDSMRTELTPAAPSTLESPIERALRMVSECKDRFQDVHDYSCDFYKRERINGKLTGLHVMAMKERTSPKSIYFKFQQPNRGREAIYVEGKNSGLVLAHDVGFTKFLAGTMHLDPKGARAMENNRHPITEAGIGKLIHQVETHWGRELASARAVVKHYPEAQVGTYPSVAMIEAVHPTRRPNLLFHKVRLYIDQETGLPIRFEAYDWPVDSRSEPELVEEYTYLNLRLNVGLTESDFDPANPGYAFGRF